MQAETLAIHADDHGSGNDVAPSISVSTTFRYPEGFNENAAIEMGILNDRPRQLSPFNIYSRDTSTTRSRAEMVLGAIEGGKAITYSSGLSALMAVFTTVQPKTIVISKGYHGTHQALELYCRGRDVRIIYTDDCTITDYRQLKKGDMVLIESPQNPLGIVTDIPQILELLDEQVFVAVDATFLPPPLQQVLLLKAKREVNLVMHSCTKALGGHSDMLGGVLITKNLELHQRLLRDRCNLGSVLGNFEAWLMLRSLRTLKLRVTQQSETAAFLAAWLQSNTEQCLAIVTKVWHASLPSHPGHEIAKRDCSGWSGVLSVELETPEYARLLVTNLELFSNATSLGVNLINEGCESLIEWRSAVDSKVSRNLCRISVGLESKEDLRADLRKGLSKLVTAAEQFV